MFPYDLYNNLVTTNKPVCSAKLLFLKYKSETHSTQLYLYIRTFDLYREVVKVTCLSSPVGFCSPLLVFIAGSWSAACSSLKVQSELQNEIGGWKSQFSAIPGMVKLTSLKLRIKKAANFLPACQTSQTKKISDDIELRAHLCITQRNCSPSIYALAADLSLQLSQSSLIV